VLKKRYQLTVASELREIGDAQQRGKGSESVCAKTPVPIGMNLFMLTTWDELSVKMTANSSLIIIIKPLLPIRTLGNALCSMRAAKFISIS